MKWLVVVVACASACNGKQSERPTVVAELAASHTPALVGAFSSIRLTPELVARDVPKKLCEHEASVAAWCEYNDAGAIWRIERLVWSDAEDKRGWPIGRLRVTVKGPLADVRAKLEAAWGVPTAAGEISYWFDPAAHLRAGLHAAQSHGDAPELVDIDFASYTPLAEFLGNDKVLFGFEHGTSLVGATARDVRARFGARVGVGQVMLPPVDTAEKPAIVHFGDAFDDEVPDRVTVYTIETHLPSDVIEKALEAKFGAPTKGDAVYHSEPDVVLDRDKIIVGAQE